MRSILALGLMLMGCDATVGELPGEGPGAGSLPFDDAGVAPAPTMDAGGTQGELPPDAAMPDGDAGPLDAGTTSSGTPDAGTPDAGTTDAGTPPVDAGSPDAGRINVLIAQGRLGRTTVSCDDGQTWVADRDEANGTQCGDPPLVECSHHTWTSMGLVDTGTSVLATWGWGAPGSVRRTTDGVTWTEVLSGSSFAGLAAGNGVVLGGGNPVQRSTADGAPGSWATGGQAAINSVSRLVAHVPAGTGRFLLVLDDGVFASDDDGQSWAALTLPMACRAPRRSVLTHDATVVLVLWNGGVCTSVDRGATWVARQLDTTFTSSGTWGQGAFHVWNESTRYRSVDGLTWTSATGTAGVSIGPVVVTGGGTFVAFKGGWQSEYQYERIYRSADGLTWQTIPTANHARSHPITHLVSARVQRSSVCR